MLKAGIKKELMLFTRGFRLWGILILVLGLTISYPALYKMVEYMDDMMGQMSELTGDAAISTGLGDTLTTIYGADMGYVGFLTGVSALVGVGLLVIMLVLMATAGGEQKKRSVIIPNCSGLTAAGYVLPKFAVYPLMTVIVVFGGVFVAGGVSNLLFGGGAVTINDMLFNGVCAASYGLFLICLYFMVGICTGKPGISVIIVYLGSELVNGILNGFHINKYNPYSLYFTIGSKPEDVDMTSIVLSVIVTLTLCVICLLITLMVAGLKKIDNSEGEANL